jgi:hypothetical protein
LPLESHAELGRGKETTQVAVSCGLEFRVTDRTRVVLDQAAVKHVRQ